MSRRSVVGRSLAALTVVAVLAGCGSAASPTATQTPVPTAAPTPTPSPTPSPTPTQAPSPTATPKVDPTVGLKIDAPYTLVELDPARAAQFEAGIETGLGSMASIMHVGVRQVMKGSVTAGLLIAMEFPGLALTQQPGFLKSVAGGMAGAGGTLTTTTISGVEVALVTAPTATWAVYKHGEGVLAVYGETPVEAKAMVTAVISANE